MFLLEDVNEDYNRFSEKVFSAGKLDQKTKELIAVACSVMADCLPCVEHHYPNAVRAGASQEEISEALAIAMSICAGSKRAKFGPLITNLEKEGEKSG